MNLPDFAEQGEASNGDRYPLEVLLLYEDFSTGLRARQAIDRVVSALNLDMDFKTNLLRFDLLRKPELLDRAADLAARADIVFLAAHSWSDLPEAVKTWFQRWLARKGSEPGALAVLLDPDARENPRAPRMVEFLQASGRPAGVEVFLRLGELAQMEPENGLGQHSSSLGHKARYAGKLAEPVARAWLCGETSK